MKKIAIFLIILLIPLVVNAKEYIVGGTDLKINLDDEMWYVFTKDNIKDNEELKFLEISEEYMQEFMDENSVYLHALMINEDNTLEIFIRKSQVEKINNLSNYSEKNVKQLAKELAKKQDAKKYDIYENKYKYAHLTYQSGEYYLDEYYTIVNKEAYTITAQSTKKITTEQKEIIQKIINTIDFTIDPKYKDDKITNWWQSIGVYAIIGGCIGAVSGLIQGLILKRKKETK